LQLIGLIKGRNTCRFSAYKPGIVWRDKIDVPSQCTIVRTMGRSAYSSKPNTQKKQLHSVSVKKTL
jgi:hypothetical protein